MTRSDVDLISEVTEFIPLGPVRSEGGGVKDSSDYSSWNTRTLAMLLVILFAGCTVGGVFVGVLLTSPALAVNPRSLRPLFSPDDKPTVLKFEIENGVKTKNIEFDVQVAFKIQLHNPSFFSIEYKVHEINFFFYPIGRDPSCLLSSRRTSDDTEFTSEGLHYLMYGPNRDDFSVVMNSLVPDAKLVIPMKCSATVVPEDYARLVMIARDCHNYGMALFSVRIVRSSSTTPLTLVELDAGFEFIAAWKCAVDPDVWLALRNVPPVLTEPLCETDV